MDVTAGSGTSKIGIQAYYMTDRPTDSSHTDDISIGYWQRTGDNSIAGLAPGLSRTHIMSELSLTGAVHMQLTDMDPNPGLHVEFKRDSTGMGAMVVDNPGPPAANKPYAVVDNPVLIDLGDVFDAAPAFFNHDLAPGSPVISTVDVVRDGATTTISLEATGGSVQQQYIIANGAIQKL